MAKRPPVIGVLALQGCVAPHRPHLEAAGADTREVRTAAEIASVDGLILPGGESTTMLKLIDRFGLEAPLRAVFESRPVWGVCAGAILMASKVVGPEQPAFNLIGMTVERNAYGRQLASRQDAVDGYTVSYIRAPRIADLWDPEAQVLARRDGDPVWLRTRRYMASTFHAELTKAWPSPMHKTFLAMVEAASRSA